MTPLRPEKRSVQTRPSLSPKAGSIEASFVEPSQRLTSLTYLLRFELPPLFAMVNSTSTRWMATSPPVASAETPTTAVVASPSSRSDVTSPRELTLVRRPEPESEPPVTPLEQATPVVGLKPTLEVHPAGYDVELEQATPVVGLKPTLEVHPAGYDTELAQEAPVVELKPTVEVQPGTKDVEPPLRANAAREIGPKYPTAGAMFIADCH